jgi:hypothetical protein
VFGKASGLRADRCPGRIAPPYLPSSDWYLDDALLEFVLETE